MPPSSARQLKETLRNIESCTSRKPTQKELQHSLSSLRGEDALGSFQALQQSGGDFPSTRAGSGAWHSSRCSPSLATRRLTMQTSGWDPPFTLSARWTSLSQRSWAPSSQESRPLPPSWGRALFPGPAARKRALFFHFEEGKAFNFTLLAAAGAAF